MPKTQFTTWTDLYKSMLDDLTSGHWRKVSSYSLPNGRTTTYRSYKEFREILNDVKIQADLETGAYCGRTLARPVGRQGSLQ